MSSPSGGVENLHETTRGQLVSVAAFQAIIWTGFALCTIAYGLRVYVRYATLRYLVAADYLMLVALLLLAAGSALVQRGIPLLYMMAEVGNHQAQPGVNFLADSERGLQDLYITTIFYVIGIYLVKLNFLIFFYRLGGEIKSFKVFWYIVLVLTIAAFAGTWATLQWNCMFVGIIRIITKCQTRVIFGQIWIRTRVACIIDVVSDVLILCLPAAILWKVRISIRKKLILGAVFGLVVFTMVVAIIRGSAFGGVYNSDRAGKFRVMNPSWLWFWYHMEFTVALFVACVVSFRTLFTHESKGAEKEKAREKRVKKRREEMNRPPTSTIGRVRGRLRNMHDTLLETCRVGAEETVIDDPNVTKNSQGWTESSGTGSEVRQHGSNSVEIDRPGKSADEGSVEKLEAAHVH